MLSGVNEIDEVIQKLRDESIAHPESPLHNFATGPDEMWFRITHGFMSNYKICTPSAEVRWGESIRGCIEEFGKSHGVDV